MSFSRATQQVKQQMSYGEELAVCDVTQAVKPQLSGLITLHEKKKNAARCRTSAAVTLHCVLSKTPVDRNVGNTHNKCCRTSLFVTFMFFCLACPDTLWKY